MRWRNVVDCEDVPQTVEILSLIFLSLFVIVFDSGGNTRYTVEIIPTTLPQNTSSPSLLGFRLQFLSVEKVEISSEVFSDDSITYTDFFVSLPSCVLHKFYKHREFT